MKSRLAKESSAGYNIAKTLAQAALFWCLLLFLIPTHILRLETHLGFSPPYNSTLKCVGVGVFCLFGALGVASGTIIAVYGKGTPLPIDCSRHLVVVGPFTFVRNPMAVAGIMQGVAVGLYLSSPLTVLYSLSGAFFWNQFMRPWEEQDLEERFGEEFRQYRKAVRCWIPNLHRYRGKNSDQ